PSGANGTVRIALQVVDDDFLPDARDRQGAPAAARPRLRNTDPAGTGLVVPAFQVPRELDLDPAVLVGVDFLAGRADHGRGLRPLHRGLGVDLHRPVGNLVPDQGQRVFVDVAATVTLLEVVARVDLRAYH